MRLCCIKVFQVGQMADMSFSEVSKLRTCQQLSNPNGPETDLTVLLITMRLHCRPRKDNESPVTDIYELAKRCCSYVERNNVFSLRLLQASLLIALYEIANALYPAAYLTVGHCARLAHVMGIHDRKEAPQMLSIPGLSSRSDCESPFVYESRRHLDRG